MGHPLRRIYDTLESVTPGEDREESVAADLMPLLQGPNIMFLEPIHHLIIWEELARNRAFEASDDPYAR